MDISQDIIRKDEQPEENYTILNARLGPETYDLLINVIKPWYRSPTVVHTLRLMIEDLARGIKEGTINKATFIFGEKDVL